MTIAEAIAQCDAMKPNQYSEAQKVAWLSNLDGMIKLEVIDTHEGGDLIEFTPYGALTDLDTTDLLVSEPYADLYTKWLFAMIDFNNAEFTRYNNSMMMFNSAYGNYATYYNRTVLPLSTYNIRTTGAATASVLPAELL